MPSGLWYQLKDVSLAAKYMNWSSRLPSPLPSAIDTMDNVAFWGTITDGEQVIATVGPGVPTFETDLVCHATDCEDEMACYWSGFLDDVAWTADALKQEFIAQHTSNKDARYWVKRALMDMYACIKLSNGSLAMVRFKSGSVEPTEIFRSISLDDHGNRLYRYHTAPARIGLVGYRADVDDGNYVDVDDEFIFFQFVDRVTSTCTSEWWQKYADFSRDKNMDKCIEMQMAYANSEANKGRGWNNTRKDIIDSVLEQLHSAKQCGGEVGNHKKHR